MRALLKALGLLSAVAGSFAVGAWAGATGVIRIAQARSAALAASHAAVNIDEDDDA